MANNNWSFRNNGGDKSYGQKGDYQQSQPAYKKHSGAKYATVKRGDSAGTEVITAWNYSKERGMVSLIISEYSKTKTSVSGNNNTFKNLFVKMTFKRTGQEVKCSGMLNVNRGTITIDRMGWVVNPKAPNGGYCGTFNK